MSIEVIYLYQFSFQLEVMLKIQFSLAFLEGKMGLLKILNPRLGLIFALVLSLIDNSSLEQWNLQHGISSYPSADVLFSKNTVKVTQALLLDQAESAIDLQYLKLSNLQHHFNVSNFHPENLGNVTFFRRKSTSNEALSLCMQIGLPSFGLEHMSPTLELQTSMLLDIEIAVGLRNLTCSTSTQVYKDEHCLSFIIAHSKSKIFFEDIFELREYLIQNYLDKTVTLAINQTHLSVTSNLYGNYGCSGLLTIPEFSLSQIYHEIFRLGLYDSQMMFLTSLDDRLNLISDTVHSLTLESSVPLLEDPSLDTISQIQSLSLGYLPNINYYQTSFSRFETFFSEKVVPSHEKALSVLSNGQFLKLLTPRTLALLLGSLKQFHYNLKTRLGTFLSSLGHGDASDIPLTLLFEQEQNPSTFVYLIRSLNPTVTDNLLTESFIILQNLKQILLSDLARLTGETYQRNFLSLTGFFNLSDKGEIPEIVSLKPSEVVEKEIFKYNSTVKNVLNQLPDYTSKLSSASLYNEALFNQTIAQRKLASLVSDYSNILLESIRISQLIDSLQSCVTSVLTQGLTPGLLSTKELRNLVPKFLRFSLLSTTSNLYFSDTGYVVEFQLPEFSETLTVYHLDQVPVFINSNWYSVSDLDTTIVLSQTLESMAYSDLKNLCPLKDGTFLCTDNTLVLRKKVNPSCSEQIVRSQHFDSYDLSSCRLERILPFSSQRYLVRNRKLLIANPLSKDTLSSTCSNDRTNATLEIGLNTISMMPNCHYESTDLLILPAIRWDRYYVDSYPSKFGTIPMAVKPDFLDPEELTMILSILSKEKELEGLPLSSLKPRIEQLQLSLSLDYLRPLSFDWNLPDKFSNYVTLLFWGEIAIALFLTILTIYLSLSHCGHGYSSWVRNTSFKFYPTRIEQRSPSEEEPTSYL